MTASQPFPYKDLHEFFANEFAMALLMPGDEVQKLISEGKSEYEMAYHFGVTVPVLQAWMQRLKARPWDGELDAAS